MASINVLAVLIIISGLHTAFTLTWNGTVIFPQVVATAGALLGIVFNYKVIDDQIKFSIAIILGVLGFLGLMSSIFMGNPVESLRSFAVFLQSIFIGLSLFAIFRNTKRSVIGLLFFMLSVILVVGSYLELYTDLGSISDSFRQFANDWRPLYMADDRDINNYGAIRPKFFASEPSVLGLTTSLCLMIWICSQKRITHLKFGLHFILFFSSLYAVRTPVIIIFYGATFILLYSMRRKLSNKILSSPVALVMSVFFGGIISYIFIQNYFYNFIDEEFLLTGSFVMRQVGPPLVAWDVVFQNPVFGLGAGRSDGLDDAILRVYGENEILGRFIYIFNFQYVTKTIISNSAYDIWVYFGVVGGSAVLYCIFLILVACSVPNPWVVVSCLYLMYFAMTGFNGPLVWGVTFVVAALQGGAVTADLPQRSKGVRRSIPAARTLGKGSP